MPSISLVVCLHGERTLFQRLLSESQGCYDELVVIHDGPESFPEGAQAPHENGRAVDLPKVPAIDYYCEQQRAANLLPYVEPETTGSRESIQALTKEYGGRYFTGPRCRQQEPHWPFAWSQAKHDWILRLDADEFPGEEMRTWLKAFRASLEPPEAVSAYTCIWPLWNGTEAVYRRWPTGRLFLLNRQRVRFFGMAEQVPELDGTAQAVDVVLHHQPPRATYGIRNVLLRRQAYYWRREIARSLMNSPCQLPRWRWSSEDWPPYWGTLRKNPLRQGLRSLFKFPAYQFRDMVKAGCLPRPSACLNPGLNHFMLGLAVLSEKRRKDQHER